MIISTEAVAEISRSRSHNPNPIPFLESAGAGPLAVWFGVVSKLSVGSGTWETVSMSLLDYFTRIPALPEGKLSGFGAAFPAASADLAKE